MPSNKFASALKTTQAPAKAVAASTPQAAPSRNGRKHVGGYFDPAVSKQLRGLALEEDSSVQQLLEEALDLLFQERGKPTIARSAQF